MTYVFLYLVYIGLTKKFARLKAMCLLYLKTCYGGQVLNVHNPVDAIFRHYNQEITSGLGNLKHQLKRVEIYNKAQLY